MLFVRAIQYYKYNIVMVEPHTNGRVGEREYSNEILGNSPLDVCVNVLVVSCENSADLFCWKFSDVFGDRWVVWVVGKFEVFYMGDE